MIQAKDKLLFTPEELGRIDSLYQNLVLPSVSFVMVTYNRCPSRRPKNNPLIWALLSLVSSQKAKISEFIVVDDCSSDYTRQSVDWIRKEYNLNLIYILNKKRKGCSFSRRIGIERCSNELFFLGDDDCLYKPYFVFGSLLTFWSLQRRCGEKLAVLNLPSFERKIGYEETESIKYIGQTAFEKQWFYHNFDKFPKEYLGRVKYLDKSRTLLKPFLIETFKGITLNNKKAIVEVGNYSDFSFWENDYPEHIELSYRLKKAGYLMFHQPEERISCIHLIYGAKKEIDVPVGYSKVYFPGLNWSLRRLIWFSNKSLVRSGCRVSSETFAVCEIGSFFSFYLKISEEYAFKHAIRELKSFTSREPLSKEERFKRYLLWKRAIKKGILVTERQTGRNYRQIYSDIIKESEKIKKIIS